MTQQLTIALTKGRILKQTLPLLQAAGLAPVEDIESSRKLIFETKHPKVRLVILRGSDVPTYVRHGAADIGVVGKDMLLEFGAEGLYEPLDLGIARCRLMTAGAPGRETLRTRVRVASKFVNIAKQYYSSKGIQADIIKLYGAMELAPLMDLADEIVDIVDTGNTLRANGMTPLEHIADVSTRLVVNKAAMRTRHGVIQEVIEALAKVVDQGGYA
ncbi:MAG: ATP phosphoribosyltransferase [Luminiphilus sp.]|nr:ATP phosphoribosyltransferase [Luminiphilus sp.]MDG1460581.1 ATP phosphoribosyltransferase [Luminiphilus sp.]